MGASGTSTQITTEGFADCRLGHSLAEEGIPKAYQYGYRISRGIYWPLRRRSRDGTNPRVPEPVVEMSI